MNIIINTEYSSFHAEMTAAEFEMVVKILSRAKAIDRVYGTECVHTKPVYALDEQGMKTGITGSLNIWATIHAPTMPMTLPDAETPNND